MAADLVPAAVTADPALDAHLPGKLLDGAVDTGAATVDTTLSGRRGRA